MNVDEIAENDSDIVEWMPKLTAIEWGVIVASLKSQLSNYCEKGGAGFTDEQIALFRSVLHISDKLVGALDARKKLQ